MSLLINGIKMPKNCGECPLSLYQYSPCWENGGAVDWENRPNWCPLILVPPHGRLIDADEATKAGWTISRTYSASPTEMVYEVKTMDFLPTIIPAEEGE